MTDGRPWTPGPARPRHARRGRRAAPPRDRGRRRHPAGRRLGGRCGDRGERGARRRRAEQLRDRRRRVLAHLGRGRGPPARAQRVGPLAGRADAAALRAAGLTDDPAARADGDHGPGRGPLVGRRARALRPARSRGCWRRPSRSHGPGSRPRPRFSETSRRPRHSSATRWAPSRVPAGHTPARAAVAAGRARPPARAGGHARGDRRRWLRRVLRRRRSGSGWRAGWRRPAPRSRPPTCAATRPPGATRSRSTTAASG